MPLKESPNPVAVIDIGSNSVRLVVYDGQKRAPSPLFNEKMLCGLAKGMNSTGALSPEGVISAHATVARFIKVTRIMGIKKVSILATSAVRDASDGKAFVKKIESLHKVKVTILSGETEAEYAGLGVISAIEATHGIVGDLGGGSLELIEVNGHKIGKGYSFPIGPLRIDTAGKTARKDYLAAIDSCFVQFPFKKLNGQSFYAVGGAFRNIAKIHSARKGYPLKVIHNLIIDAKELYATLEVISRMSPSALQKMPGIPRKRMDFLPFAALIAMRIIETGKPKNFIFSATGIREGLLFSKLPEDVQQQDPLISGATEMMRRVLRTPQYGIELAEWVAPLLVGANKISPRLVIASCILGEISCFENTEYRAEIAYRLILDSSLTGINHRERLFIAKTLYCRYSTHPDEDILAAMEPLLDEDSARKAHILGSSMRLARSISASCPGSLAQMPLKLSKNNVVLILPKNFSQLAGEVLDKRLKFLAGALGVSAKLKIEK